MAHHDRDRDDEAAPPTQGQPPQQATLVLVGTVRPTVSLRQAKELVRVTIDHMQTLVFERPDALPLVEAMARRYRRTSTRLQLAGVPPAGVTTHAPATLNGLFDLRTSRTERRLQLDPMTRALFLTVESLALEDQRTVLQFARFLQQQRTAGAA